MPLPHSWYSASEIHIDWSEGMDAKRLPPSHAPYRRSALATCATLGLGIVLCNECLTSAGRPSSQPTRRAVSITTYWESIAVVLGFNLEFQANHEALEE